MKIAVFGVYHETNTFAPGFTEIKDFADEWVLDNERFLQRYTDTRTSMGGVIDALHQAGVQMEAGLYTAAMPGGMVTAQAADYIMDALLDSVSSRVDGVMAILHGAMVSTNYPDFEGELLHRTSQKVGASLPIAVTLDLHANVTPLMMDCTDIVVGYDTYPHVDAYDRAMEAANLLIRTIRSEIKPVHALAYPRMLIVPQVMQTAEAGAYKEIMDQAFSIERDPRVLSASVIGGFPYSDVPDAGMAFIVTTNGEPALARQYADELCRMAWDNRGRLLHVDTPVADAVSMAVAQREGPVILIEGSDNVGGGAPGDATHTLRALIHASTAKKCLIVMRDEEIAKTAQQLGIGAALHAEIGGKSDQLYRHLHGAPIHVSGIVRQLSEGNYQHTGPYMTGQWAYMGKTAVVEADNLTIVITENRVAPWDPGHICSLGLHAEDYHIIVVKSAIAWQTAFGSVCRHQISLDTPGCCSANLNHFKYKQLKRPIYPLDPIM